MARQAAAPEAGNARLAGWRQGAVWEGVVVILYGFWSEKAYAQSRESSYAGNPGYTVWTTPHGTTVRVTAVYGDQEAPQYLWTDKTCLGQVLKCVRGNISEGLK